MIIRIMPNYREPDGEIRNLPAQRRPLGRVGNAYPDNINQNLDRLHELLNAIMQMVDRRNDEHNVHQQRQIPNWGE